MFRIGKSKKEYRDTSDDQSSRRSSRKNSGRNQTRDIHDDRLSLSADRIQMGPMPLSEPEKTKAEKRVVVEQYFDREKQVDGEEACDTFVGLMKTFGISEENTIGMFYQAILEAHRPKKTKAEKRAVIVQYFAREKQVDGEEACDTFVGLMKTFGISEENTIEMFYQAIV